MGLLDAVKRQQEENKKKQEALLKQRQQAQKQKAKAAKPSTPGEQIRQAVKKTDAQKKANELSKATGRDALVKHAYAMAEERSAANKSTKAKGRMATPRNTAAIQSRKAAPTVDKILDKTPYKKGKDLTEVETRKYNDNFGGQFKANYTLGDLQQQSAYAWNLFMKHPNQHYLKRAQDIDKAMETFQANNTEALDDENAKAPWVSKSLAGYLPQLKNQAAEAGAALALGGAAGVFGAPMGIATKAGYMGGMTSAAYDSMKGMAYKNLRDMGVDDATARAAAQDEAILSSIVELGESGIDVLTFGFGRLFGAAGKKAVTPAAKNAARKLFNTLRAYGVQVGGESLEEGLQESVSIANERRAQQGQTGLGNLLLDSDRVLQDAITGRDQESRQRIGQAMGEGAKISAMMGGGTVIAPNIAANRIEARNRRYADAVANLQAEIRKQQENRQRLERGWNDLLSERQKNDSLVNQELAQTSEAPTVSQGVMNSWEQVLKRPERDMGRLVIEQARKSTGALSPVESFVDGALQEGVTPEEILNFSSGLPEEEQKSIRESLQKYTATEDQRQGEDKNAAPGTDTATLTRALQTNIDKIADMSPVATLTGNELPAQGKAVERAMSFLSSIGGKVNRAGFGEVLFSKTRLKNSLVGHGMGDAKIELVAAVPQVIQNGRQIGFEKNWKGRGYDTYIFAGPVEYRGGLVHVAAIVTREKDNRYYLHEAVDDKGNVLLGEEKARTLPADRSANQQNTVAISELFNDAAPVTASDVVGDSIPQNPNGVNTVYAGGGENMQSGGYMAFEQRNPTLTEEVPVEPAPAAERRDYSPSVEAYTQQQARAGSFNAGVQSAQEGPIDNERRFVTNSLSKSPALQAVQEAILAAGKEARGSVSISEQMAAADRSIQEMGGYDEAAWRYLSSDGKALSATSNAVLLRLINYYAERGDVGKSADLASKFAAATSDQARALNILKYINMFGPQSALIQAQKTIQRIDGTQELTDQDAKDIMAIGEALKRSADANGAVIIPADLDYLSEDMRKWMEQAAEYVEKGILDWQSVLTAKNMAIVSNRIPAKNIRKYQALQRISMLANLKTQGRNIGGNLGQGTGWVAAKPLTKAVDKVLSLMTGENTALLFSTKGMGSGAVKGAQKVVAEAKLGINTVAKNRAQDGEEFGIQGRAFNPEFANSTIMKKLYWLGDKADQAVGLMLQMGDEPFFKAYYNNILHELMVSNGVTEPTAEMKQAALDNALINVFQDDNKLTKQLEAVRRALGPMGYVVAPYVRTPVNVLKVAAEYSPVGLVEGLMKTFYGENSLRALKASGKSTMGLQRQIADMMGRGFLGTALIGLGFLANSLTGEGGEPGGDERDQKSRFWVSTKGGNAQSIRIGDWYLDFSSMQGPITSFMIGAAAGKDPYSEDTGFDAAKALKIMSQIGGGALEMPVMQGVRDLLSGSYTDESIGLGLLGMIFDGALQAVPGASLLKQISAARDPYVRTNKSSRQGVGKVLDESLINPLKNTFGMRGSLPIKRDMLGREVQNTAAKSGAGRALNTLLNPLNTSRARDTDVTRELDRLRKVRGGNDVLLPYVQSTTSSDNQEYRLTQDEKAQWEKTRGQTWNETLDSLFKSQEYKNASDEDKVKLIQQAATMSRNKAKEEFLDKKGVAMPDDEKGSLLRTADRLKSETGLPYAKSVLWHSKLDKMETVDEKNRALLDATDLTKKQKKIMSQSWAQNWYHKDNTKDIDFTNEDTFYSSQITNDTYQNHYGRFRKEGYSWKDYYEILQCFHQHKADTLADLQQTFGYSPSKALRIYKMAKLKNY